MRLPTPLLNLFRRTAAPATAVRRFDGAAGGRRGFSMGTFHRINSEVAGAGASVRSRARYLAINNPWLAQGVANWAGALVGPGITPTPKHPDAATRKALVTAWNLWTEEADADGRTDFNGMQADIARGLVIDGEAFLQVITTEDGPRLRLLPPELVDESMTRELAGGAVIVQGVEFDGEGRRVAYHVLPSRPQDQFATYAPPVRIPADQILHVFKPLAAGLHLHPQLQVLDAIIGPHAVLVMDVLPRLQRTPEVLFHDHAVFHDPAGRAMHAAVAVLVQMAGSVSTAERFD